MFSDVYPKIKPNLPSNSVCSHKVHDKTQKTALQHAYRYGVTCKKVPLLCSFQQSTTLLLFHIVLIQLVPKQTNMTMTDMLPPSEISSLSDAQDIAVTLLPLLCRRFSRLRGHQLSSHLLSNLQRRVHTEEYFWQRPVAIY